MDTFTAILTPSLDGTLHLPLPVAWRRSPVRVKVEMEPMPDKPTAPPIPDTLKGFGCLRGQIKMAPDFDEPLADFQDYMA